MTALSCYWDTESDISEFLAGCGAEIAPSELSEERLTAKFAADAILEGVLRQNSPFSVNQYRFKSNQRFCT